MALQWTIYNCVWLVGYVSYNNMSSQKFCFISLKCVAELFFTFKKLLREYIKLDSFSPCFLLNS